MNKAKEFPLLSFSSAENPININLYTHISMYLFLYALYIHASYRNPPKVLVVCSSVSGGTIPFWGDQETWNCGMCRETLCACPYAKMYATIHGNEEALKSKIPYPIATWSNHVKSIKGNLTESCGPEKLIPTIFHQQLMLIPLIL